jgi:hypothetical protein
VGTAHRLAKRPNDERDEFIFREYEKMDRHVKEIRTDVNSTPGWKHLADDSGVRRVYERYCNRNMLTPKTRKRSRI